MYMNFVLQGVKQNWTGRLEWDVLNIYTVNGRQPQITRSCEHNKWQARF